MSRFKTAKREVKSDRRRNEPTKPETSHKRAQNQNSKKLQIAVFQNEVVVAVGLFTSRQTSMSCKM